ncbi:peptidyl-prolyl cis-trans isomerase FKBP17-2, chloroplastic-like [Panicum miliaceum]|uniref:Peptidyl-prolyl cis-trans isomerase FKBP17-2, chloroplastic-like n=1 Tax=Panicum miliaceum TaxID=4540 RepID=A0A3L6RMD9_PANMI|nr:peptidyl-prolyl cis-trans isomerase FKBP17-2, chloroplastic-like [Panicum miliaceum]
MHWVASPLTRRFGIDTGLAWAGFLAVGVVSEQLKTRFEVVQQQANTKDVEQEQEVVLPNGIRYYELRVGGGDVPRPDDLVVIDLQDLMRFALMSQSAARALAGAAGVQA